MEGNNNKQSIKAWVEKAFPGKEKEREIKEKDAQEKNDKDVENNDKEIIQVIDETHTSGKNEDKGEVSFVNQNYPADSDDTTNNLANQGENLVDHTDGGLEWEDFIQMAKLEQEIGVVSDTNEEEGIGKNINQVSLAGDLSPRQTSTLKSIRTRSSKGKTFSCPQ